MPTPFAIAIAAVLAALVLAAAAAVRRRRTRAASDRMPLDAMQSREFEALVAEAFRSQGYLLIETPQGGPAGVGELVVRRERTTFLVDCRWWRAGKVGVDAVHALQSAMAARGADGGFVLTTGRFGREAVAYAGGCNIQLVDRPALEVLLRRVSRR